MEERTICQLVCRVTSGFLVKWVIPCSLMAMVLCAGCGGPEPTVPPPAEPVVETGPAEVERRAVEPSAPVGAPATSFSPVGVSILPLTELTHPTGDQGRRLNVFVSLQDAFGSQMKAPGTFRIELYDYVQRSAEPKGQRIAIWPDIDLTNPAENQKYWRDFLRAYEFTVPAQISPDKTYVLEVTCMIPAGRRLSAEWMLRPGE
jgi:hypothetical protein